jgi:hypothetical protein
MNSRQIRYVFIIALIVLLCWLTAPFWGGSAASSLPLYQGELQFNGGQAFQITRDFVTRNPIRALGSIEARQATGFLQDALKTLGYQVSFSHFDAIVDGSREVGRNILGYREGERSGILVIAAHYDTARTAFQGAMDNGAGVGALLELARVFAGSPLRHSLLILATDGEEWGMLGAADIAETYPDRQRIAAVLSLDGVGIGDLSGFQLATDGQFGGYSPMWLRRISFSAVASHGLPVRISSGVGEIMQRAILISRSDQGPFLREGIPAINLGSISVDRERAAQVYHSDSDTIENLKPDSLREYGRAAERIARSIDEMDAAAPVAQGDFQWSAGTFVSGWAVTLLQYLAFLPLLAALAFSWRKYGRSLSLEAIRHEATLLLIWLIPFALIYSSIHLCRLLRLLPRASLYPGPLKDPMLDNPAWGLLAGILITAILIGTGVHYMARYLMDRPRRSYGASKMILLSLLVVLVIVSLQYNPYWAIAFLTLPALIWSTLPQSRGGRNRAAGALAIPAAGCLVPAAAYFLQGTAHSDANIVWLAVLGLSNGMFHWQGFFLTASAMLLGMRLMALQFTSPAE